MTLISWIIVKYALVVVALAGVWESLGILRMNRRDLRTLLHANVNGPKRISTELRINQSAYLLAVFCVMLLMALAQALTDAIVTTSTLVTRSGVLIIGAILMANQRSILRHRERLDEYYDQQQRDLAAQAKLHVHRRATDAPLSTDDDAA